MTFEIELRGRGRTVSIEPAGSGPRPDHGRGSYRVTIDGQPRHVQAARVGEFGLSFIVDGCDDGAGVSREVQVAPGSVGGELLVVLEGRTVGVMVNMTNGRRTGRAAADAGGHAHGELSVVAPMPGRIVRVLVGPGDEVAARQSIVVVEAMKMENELRSPKAGRVKEVKVSTGASVEAGRVLVVIE